MGSKVPVCRDPDRVFLHAPRVFAGVPQRLRCIASLRAFWPRRHWPFGKKWQYRPSFGRRENLYTMLSPERRIWGYETNVGSLAELALALANQLMRVPLQNLAHGL